MNNHIESQPSETNFFHQLQIAELVDDLRVTASYVKHLNKRLNQKKFLIRQIRGVQSIAAISMNDASRIINWSNTEKHFIGTELNRMYHEAKDLRRRLHALKNPINSVTES